MIVYRISKQTYCNDLSGTGARLTGGRWNSKGIAVLYTASSLSLAMLECLVHFDKNNIPTDLVVSEIEILRVRSKIIKIDELPDNWNSWPHSTITQQFGDAILSDKTTLCAKFPSAVNPKEFNLLINPKHKRFTEVKIVNQYPLVLDERLIK